MKLSLSFFLIVHLGVVLLEKLPSYERTPFGLGWNQCIHEVPAGSHIEEQDDQTTITYPNGEIKVIGKCDRPFKRNKLQQNKRDSPNDGWQVWSAFNNEGNATFNSFLGYFNVPTEPVWRDFESGILYMFTALQNDNWIPISDEFPTPPYFDIIQPVLQFGSGSVNGGGNYWGLASWYVTLDGQSIWSTLEKVNAGDEIFGNMTRINETTWYIGAQIIGRDINTYITVNHARLNTQPWAYCTLEVYNIDDCNQFPPTNSPMVFKDIILTDNNGKVTPKWQVLNNGGDHCGATITVGNQVVITF